MSVNLLADIFKIKKTLAISPEQEAKFSDDALCRRCGQCCYSSVLYQDRLTIIPELPCRYLKRESEAQALCSIYPDREKFAQWCNKVTKETVSKGLFPGDCPYVQGIPGYQGKVRISEAEREKFYRYLARIFPGQIKPEYISETDWSRFLLKLQNLRGTGTHTLSG